jgi:hypothetical protein
MIQRELSQSIYLGKEGKKSSAQNLFFNKTNTRALVLFSIICTDYLTRKLGCSHLGGAIDLSNFCDLEGVQRQKRLKKCSHINRKKRPQGDIAPIFFAAVIGRLKQERTFFMWKRHGSMWGET